MARAKFSESQGPKVAFGTIKFYSLRKKLNTSSLITIPSSTYDNCRTYYSSKKKKKNKQSLIHEFDSHRLQG